MFAVCRSAALSLSAVAVATASASVDRGAPLKEAFPWLHSGDEIHDGLQELSTHCEGAQVEVSQHSAGAMTAGSMPALVDVVRVSRAGGASQKTKAMLVFGEHARELISPESALHFARTLCGQGPAAKNASRVLDSVEFTIVPNANPLGRKDVEGGDYCKRTNENNVDLNRNFGDDHRDDSVERQKDESAPGPSGFSEPESQIIRDLLDDVKPDVYLSVHSGAYLLGSPMGYTDQPSTRSAPDADEILGRISERYCNGDCPYGNMAELIHYDSPGCDIDYVSEHVGTPYVYTWEIYTGPRFRAQYVENAHLRKRRGSFLQGRAKLRGTRLSAEMPEGQQFVSNCIEEFNPQTADETAAVVENWSGAYLELCAEVAARKAAR